MHVDLEKGRDMRSSAATGSNIITEDYISGKNTRKVLAYDSQEALDRKKTYTSTKQAHQSNNSAKYSFDKEEAFTAPDPTTTSEAFMPGGICWESQNKANVPGGTCWESYNKADLEAVLYDEEALTSSVLVDGDKTRDASKIIPQEVALTATPS